MTLGIALQLHAGSLATLDATKHILVACDGVAAFVNDFMLDLTIASESLSPHAQRTVTCQSATLPIAPSLPASRGVPGLWPPSDRHHAGAHLHRAKVVHTRRTCHLRVSPSRQRRCTRCPKNVGCVTSCDARAGDSLPSRDAFVCVLDAVRQLCDASATMAVDLFCRGVLGKVLRAAQPVVTTQPSAAEGEKTAAVLFLKGLEEVVAAFGRAVPQARTFLRAPPF